MERMDEGVKDAWAAGERAMDSQDMLEIGNAGRVRLLGAPTGVVTLGYENVKVQDGVSTDHDMVAARLLSQDRRGRAAGDGAVATHEDLEGRSGGPHEGRGIEHHRAVAEVGLGVER